MKSIELRDVKDHVFLSLHEVFSALPPRAFASFWSAAEFVDGDGEDYFEVASIDEDAVTRLADGGGRVRGTELALIAESVPQVIWATFRGYDTIDAQESWITLHAIDSHFWRCETRDIPTRQALMKSFKDVRLVE